MNSPKSPEEVLKGIFPLLLVALALVGGIFLFPRLQQTNLDERSRASEPSVTVSRVTVTPSAGTPEVVCSSLYEPVCGSDNQTYPNACEANLAKISQFTLGECGQRKNQLPTPRSLDEVGSPSPVTLPTSN